MEKWYCFKCKQEMTEAELLASYLDITQFVNGIKCPSCGTAYLTEQYVIEAVQPGEEQIESKLA